MGEAKVYTQVIESLPVLELPHPNPPLIKGRELVFPVSPLYKGGLRGVKPGSQSNSDLCVHCSLAKGWGDDGVAIQLKNKWARGE
ncbi:hypothetical protein NIES2100_76750 [Calothrix sp. NIES-2100]|nr:hypothetical protein NIES2100_76750 [Calothrix sp. NIES-2100]